MIRTPKETNSLHLISKGWRRCYLQNLVSFQVRRVVLLVSGMVDIFLLLMHFFPKKFGLSKNISAIPRMRVKRQTLMSWWRNWMVIRQGKWIDTQRNPSKKALFCPKAWELFGLCSFCPKLDVVIMFVTAELFDLFGLHIIFCLSIV